MVQQFREGNFNLQDSECSDQPKKVKDEELEQILDKNPCQTQLKLASKFRLRSVIHCEYSVSIVRVMHVRDFEHSQ